MMIHGHGNHITQYPNLVADFSSNVWYQGTPTALLGALKDHLGHIRNYPEPDAMQLRQKVARFHDLDASRVLVTNGSTEAFYLVARAFVPTRSVIVAPAFVEYCDACNAYQHQTEYLINNSGWQNQKFSAGMVWMANPNNPDGKTLSRIELENLLRQNPQTTFVLDEAYNELCFGAESAIPLLDQFKNLIIIRSFTKAFAIPGIRLGYMLASQPVIEKITSLMMPWNVNTLALVSGHFIIDHYQQLLPDAVEMYNQSQAFQQAMTAIFGLTVHPSHCNYFLVQLHNKKASELKQYLIQKHGLLIRDASNFYSLDETFFRVALQASYHNHLLIQAIDQWMH